MHAEHAIGRFLHGGFTRACRVMAVVIQLDGSLCVSLSFIQCESWKQTIFNRNGVAEHRFLGPFSIGRMRLARAASNLIPHLRSRSRFSRLMEKL